VKVATLASLAACAVAGCTIGEGGGEVTSERLYVEDCWNGAFDLQPTFFGANPYHDTMHIRIQRGEKNAGISDGVLLVVNEVSQIRAEQLGQELRIGLPEGVSPPGLPERTVTDPAPVSFTLYLYETCHLQNGALYAIDGTIRFDSLFSGDPNETDADDRLTEASFEATVVDPRDFEMDAPSGDMSPVGYPEEKTSRVTGNFRFFFQRGTPAQAFP
jgi:hypothetical protein